MINLRDLLTNVLVRGEGWEGCVEVGYKISNGFFSV